VPEKPCGVETKRGRVALFDEANKAATASRIPNLELSARIEIAKALVPLE